MPIGTKRLLLIFLALLHGVAYVAQPDSTATEAIEETPVIFTGGVPESAGRVNAKAQDTLDWRERHGAHKASLYSAVLPGAGQIYNRKYWKAPIVWAGLGTCVWFINDNTSQYKYYRREYLAMVDNDPDTVSEFEGEFAPEAVRDVMDTYRRWRDLSYIAFGLVYMLNIVDASVDAHFVRFDVGPDLSLRLGPSLPVAAQGGLGIGMALTLR